MIDVLIVTDVRFYREGLAELLPRSPQIAAVRTASGTDDMLEHVREREPHIVLFDTALPNGIEAVTRVTSSAPAVKVVALALSESEDEVIRWAEAGVAGYVPRDASIGDLVAAVESTVRGELHCSPRVAATMLRRLGQLAMDAHDAHGQRASVPLTPREREIVDLIGQGLSNKDIARTLGIQVATAKTHVHNILEKLHLRRRIEILAQMRQRM